MFILLKEVIISGGGPAGTYLAYLLASKGLEVLLLEKGTPGRPKPCAGGITHRAAQELDFDLAPVIEEVITRFVFTSCFANPVEVITDIPAVYTVHRERFDAFLQEKAAAAGAEILTGARIEAIEAGSRGFRIRSGGSNFYCKILAGADGASSITARLLGLDSRAYRGFTLDCHLFLPPEQAAPFRGTIGIDYGFLHRGYTWVFPKKDCLSIGAGAIRGASAGLRPALNKMIRALNLKDHEIIIPKRGWLLPLNPFPQQLHRGAALLLGDAAGLVDSFTGEGIYYALKSARLAAEVIAAEAGKKDPHLGAYSALVKARIGADLATAWRLSRLFYRNAPFFHRLLQRRPEIAHEFLQVPAGLNSYSHFFRCCLNLLLRESRQLLLPT